MEVTPPTIYVADDEKADGKYDVQVTCSAHDGDTERIDDLPADEPDAELPDDFAADVYAEPGDDLPADEPDGELGDDLLADENAELGDDLPADEELEAVYNWNDSGAEDDYVMGDDDNENYDAAGYDGAASVQDETVGCLDFEDSLNNVSSDVVKASEKLFFL